MKKTLKLNCSSQFVMFLFLILLGSLKGFAQDANEALKKVDKEFFIENKGQWPEEVLFLSRQNGLNFWITKKGIVQDFYKIEKKTEDFSTDIFHKNELNETGEIKGQVVNLTSLNPNKKMEISANKKCSSYYNYMIGNNKKSWVSNVGLYKEVLLKNTFEGIDLRYYFDENYIRYDYIVNPNASPSTIEMKIEGSEKEYINEQGELVFTTVLGDVKQAKLLGYQIINGMKTIVPVKFRLTDKSIIGFQVGDYNKAYPLVIDPIIYIGVLSGSALEKGLSIVADGSQNSYTAGVTLSSNFPTTPGAYQTTFPGLTCGFVSKVNSTGTLLLYSTFIGGTFGNSLYGIDIDQATGNAYVTGTTASINYPTLATFTPLNPTFQGVQDAVLSILNSTGNTLIYSTYLGAAKADWGLSVKVNQSNPNIVCVGGYTWSTNSYPVPTGPTLGALTFTGSYAATITRLNYTLGAGGVLFSRYLTSGAGNDASSSIALDPSGNIYMTGLTNSNTPTTATTFPGLLILGSLPTASFNFFATKLDLNGNILYSTMGGGSVDNIGESIGVNSSGEAYVVGITASPNFPVTMPASAGGTYYGGTQDIFVSKVSILGNIVESRFVGGSNADQGLGIKVHNDRPYITGWTLSGNYPIVPCPSTGILLARDVLVTEFDPYLNIIYSETIPISGLDQGNSIDVDGTGIYVTGFYTSFSFAEEVIICKLKPFETPNPCINSGTGTLNGSITSSPASMLNGYRMTGDITINASLNFNSLDIGVMGPFSITVRAPHTLTIQLSHIHCCNGMWKGIIVMPGARLIIEKESLIEDALVAVDVSSATPTTQLIAERAIFNRNLIGIRIKDFNQSIPVYPFFIKNSVFTSRDLTAYCGTWPNWFSTGDLKLTNTPANNLMTPYLMKNTGFLGLKNGDLRPAKHIELINVGKTDCVFLGPCTYYEQYIGGDLIADLNLYDHSNIGVDGINCNFAVVNSVFQNMERPYNTKDASTAIRATKDPTLQTYNQFMPLRVRSELVAGSTSLNNKFFNCFEGIVTTNYNWHELSQNDFRSNQNVNNLTGIAPNEQNLNSVGFKAIDVIAVNYENMNISDNYIANHTVGIHQVSGIANPNPAFPTVKIGLRSVDRNLCFDRPIGNPLTTTFLGDAIVINLLNGTGGSIGGLSSPYANTLNENYIQDAYRGIQYDHFVHHNLTSYINTNTIRLRQDFYPDHGQNGIVTWFNSRLVLQNNTSEGCGFAPTQFRNTNFSSVLNFLQIVDCNLSMNTYSGFKFFAVNPGTIWTINTMDRGHHFGYELDINGEIGVQGNPTDAIDNRWLGAYIGGHTRVSNGSNAVNSILHVRGLGSLPYSPIINSGIFADSYNLPGNLVNAILPASPKTCGGDPTISIATFTAKMEEIVLDSLQYGIYEDESRWMAKQRVFDLLKADSSYADSSIVIQNFYDSTCPAGIRIIHIIEDSIDAGKYYAAQAVSAAFVPTNAIETNYQTYYRILLKYITTGICDSSDSTTLNQLAWKCLFIDGPSVSKARILYNSIYRQQYTVFDDNCRKEGEGGGFGEESNRQANGAMYMGNKFLVDLYPNPASFGFNLKSNCKENCEVKVEVLTITGQKLFEKNCDLLAGNCFINTHLTSGTYMVKITKIETMETITQKLIITNR